MLKLWPYLRTKSSTSISDATTQNDERYGLKAWSQPANAIVDIVFVHGLSGHRERTWSVKGGLGFWPRDFLAPRLPEARILTFGYDANIVKTDSPVSNNRVGDHAGHLLSTLADYREKDETIDRPIIFVAHSLGGLVCEDALIASRASSEEHLRQIGRCTRGISFFGTPHTGTDLASSMDRLVKWVAFTRQVNTRIAKVLYKDSEVLARIRNDFHSLLRSRVHEGYPPIHITCFYEELPVPRFGEIVPKSSAILPSYPAIGIHSNHREMVKFPTENDPGFLSLLNELLRWIKDIHMEGEAIHGYADAVPSQPSSNGPQSTVSRGQIVIGGNVIQSTIVNGCQKINGDLSFT